MLHIGKILFLLFLAVIVVHNESNASHNNVFVSDTLVKINGKISDGSNENAVEARIIYEKLPYGDDMGMAKSVMPDGNYEMYMLKGSKYLVKVTCKGYEPYEKEIAVNQMNEEGEFELDFVLEPTLREQVMRLENLLFRTGRAEITESSFAELDELAELMKSRESMVIQLEGHTDIEGGEEANLELSEKRVLAVREYLEDKGVKGKRIKVKAFGETQPLTTERTPEGKRLNRRVEVRIIQQ
jgi:outer membrane protein OmpA-like peptidoglycan-associated protein